MNVWDIIVLPESGTAGLVISPREFLFLDFESNQISSFKETKPLILGNIRSELLQKFYAPAQKVSQDFRRGVINIITKTLVKNKIKEITKNVNSNNNANSRTDL